MRVRKCAENSIGNMNIKLKTGYLIRCFVYLSITISTVTEASSYTEILSPEAKEQAQLALMHQIYGFETNEEARAFQRRITYIQELQNSITNQLLEEQVLESHAISKRQIQDVIVDESGSGSNQANVEGNRPEPSIPVAPTSGTELRNLDGLFVSLIVLGGVLLLCIIVGIAYIMKRRLIFSYEI